MFQKDSTTALPLKIGAMEIAILSKRRKMSCAGFFGLTSSLSLWLQATCFAKRRCGRCHPCCPRPNRPSRGSHVCTRSSYQVHNLVDRDPVDHFLSCLLPEDSLETQSTLLRVAGPVYRARLAIGWPAILLDAGPRDVPLRTITRNTLSWRPPSLRMSISSIDSASVPTKVLQTSLHRRHFWTSSPSKI